MITVLCVVDVQVQDERRLAVRCGLFVWGGDVAGLVNLECLNGEVLGVESGWTSCPHPQLLGPCPARRAAAEQACLVSRLIYGLGVFNMLLPHPSQTQHHKLHRGAKTPSEFLTKY